MDIKGTDIRKPAVAGTFYPGSATDLVKAIAQMFAEVDKVMLPHRPLALIAPHAGYPYSGKVAAKAYKLLEGEQYDTVVIVAPSHTVFFQGCSVFGGRGYETPLGVVETDIELGKRIASIHPSVYFSAMGHATGSTRGEHALEVHLPFLQVALGKFKLVAIVMGDQEEESVFALGETLAAALRGTNTLMVASTDLSHFHNERQARRLDNTVRAAIEKCDPRALLKVIQSGDGEACGGGPVASILMAAQKLGTKDVRYLDYANSGDVTGDFSEVVGYLSAAVVASPEAEAARQEVDKSTIGARQAPLPGSIDLTDEDRQALLQIARDAILARLEGRKYEPEPQESLGIRRGAFVTLKIDGDLRGCIGFIKAREPLYQIVAEMAVAAAFEDPRFPSLTRAEYDRLEYEISVLSSLERVHDFSSIVVGRHGLMIKLDMHSGLLLPQVATEYGWTATEFLEQTCLKAGLSKESYKDKFAEVYKFSAVVF
jgi:AmmeMemoRadiSam system protein B/AmmeMemoRadiSam system protein A